MNIKHILTLSAVAVVLSGCVGSSGDATIPDMSTRAGVIAKYGEPLRVIKVTINNTPHSVLQYCDSSMLTGRHTYYDFVITDDTERVFQSEEYKKYRPGRSCKRSLTEYDTVSGLAVKK